MSRHGDDRVVEMVEADGVTHRAWLWHCPACAMPHQCDDRWTFKR